ncbi:16S rRNA (guanine(527)-N(7))-methyltransferase RsmG [Sporohalobacter salinus]|uniref:16S rRNA (guanine(527)-N(7))-methyltransferase RsmG n=1 Tax=Sporohalobacter salinus TaxID=1494606 RepID=UPI0019604E5A|nr:16S rRNA (guanine(527)-N(7))-methyltransferase RsmG [Sporohalobacter salinus]MBM7624309.1 16S rRNA (guanine527-N7)-methyltransferase [Sporohalobacter salinus]
MKTKDLLVSGADELGQKLNTEQIDQFLDYLDILRKWNQKMNLTAIDDPEQIVVKHFLDSISCASAIDLTSEEKIIDLGTGAGFPGIPLKILYPSLELTLLDSTKKRITFLKNLVRKLGLDKIEFIHGRAEDYGQKKEYRQGFDIVISRAVASLNILSEYSVPFLKPSGSFLAQKGAKVKEEVVEATRAIEVLGAEIYDVVPINLPYTDAERNLVIIDKIRETPLKYPRKAGTPSQEPISN